MNSASYGSPPPATQKPSLLVCVTGASGSIYGVRFLEAALPHFDPIYAVFSARGREVMQHELGVDPGTGGNAVVKLLGEKAAHVKAFSPRTMNAPFASGSAVCDATVVIPCSMGTLSRIAAGVSDDLVTRAADVVLKERRKLILVPRETPLSTLHLRNMLALSEMGVTLMPASPPYYHRPESVEDLVKMVVDRVLVQAGVKPGDAYRWGSDPTEEIE
ncbi:MAG: UbiX family flavin prenyltransferase [Armatimonadetes bacterium]|nr:UbiX family flavin prenyltransferase [Armatimonadota bacterium]